MQDLGFYDAMAASSAARHGIPLAWLKAVIGAETSFEIPAPNRWEPNVNGYAYGPMQILLSTAQQFYPGMTAAELELPDTNVDVGAAFIRYLMDRYGDDFQRVYSAYNSGRPDSWEASAQVRSNVERALTWLEQFVPAGIVEAGATVSENAGNFLVGVLVIAFLIFRKKR
jgi:soluble lytic murein transglycosylase-like protein